MSLNTKLNACVTYVILDPMNENAVLLVCTFNPTGDIKRTARQHRISISLINRNFESCQSRPPSRSLAFSHSQSNNNRKFTERLLAPRIDSNRE